MLTLVKRKLEWLCINISVDFRTKNITRDEKRHFIIIKGSFIKGT